MRHGAHVRQPIIAINLLGAFELTSPSSHVLASIQMSHSRNRTDTVVDQLLLPCEVDSVANANDVQASANIVKEVIALGC